MGTRKREPEEVVAKLRQVDVPVSRAQSCDGRAGRLPR